jgi:hypothetical protein
MQVIQFEDRLSWRAARLYAKLRDYRIRTLANSLENGQPVYYVWLYQMTSEQAQDMKHRVSSLPGAMWLTDPEEVSTEGY